MDHRPVGAKLVISIAKGKRDSKPERQKWDFPDYMMWVLMSMVAGGAGAILVVIAQGLWELIRTNPVDLLRGVGIMLFSGTGGYFLVRAMKKGGW